VEDIQSLDQPTPVLQTLLAEGFRSVYNVPMMGAGELIGVLNLAMRQPGILLQSRTVVWKSPIAWR